MGNALGIDCSLNYVYVTNVLINEKKKKKNVNETKNKCNICFPKKNVLEYDNIKNLYSLNSSYNLDIKKNKDENGKKCLRLEKNIINKNYLENYMKEKLPIIENEEEVFNKNCEGNKENDNAKYFFEEIKRKKEKENTLFESTSNNKIMNKHIDYKEKILNRNSKNTLKKLERKNETHNNADNRHFNDYMRMQKDFFDFIIDTQHVIEDTVQFIILKEEIEKSQSGKFSLGELSKYFKENEDLNNKFHIYINFIQGNLGYNLQKEEKNNLYMNDEINEFNDEIAQIYFWKIKLKKIDEVIIKYSNFTKNILINITGENGNYIKKKLTELAKMSNLYCHKELKCINSSICFLKQFYPKGLYYFMNSNISNVKDTSTSKSNEMMLKKCFLNKKEASEIFPYIIVNIKRGVTYHLINEDNLIENIGRYLIGCKSILGLFLLLTGKLCSLEIICKLANNGISKTFDMTVEDIYGTIYSKVGLQGNIVASFFGKAQDLDNANNSVDSSSKEIYLNMNKDILDNCEHVSSFEYLSFESNESDEYDNNSNSHNFLKNKNNKFTHLNMNSKKNSLENSFFNFHSDSCCNYNSVVIKEKKLLQKKKKKINIKGMCESNYLTKETANNKKDDGIKNDIYKKEIKYFGGDSDNDIIMRKVTEKNILLRKSLSDSKLKVNRCNEVNDFKGKGRNTYNSFQLKSNEYAKKKKFYSTLNILSNEELNNILMKKIISNSDEEIIKKKSNRTNNYSIGKMFKKKKISNKNTTEIISSSEDNEQNNFFIINSEKKRKHFGKKNEGIMKFDTKECDIAKSLLSMAIFTMVQLSYFYSQMYNIKSIIFSGLLLNNNICLALVKIIINIMSNNTQRLYFFKFSEHLSSLGSALHLIDWNNLLLKS
ncbi:pantothenate kinase, putative [Plasmodium relictum]|uniref:Pantothenate kinase, putative n=1 Tax=Plasmodium relictum TaxID=85471 RepID=A0A1J1HH24_PLARL|nr:pantothenate kinase, putative [Plasmodium relictum]CRH03777.1 pantothenate kinase, putative [Plasmodium relictum]